MAVYLGPVQRVDAKMSISKSLPGRPLTIYFPATVWGIQLPINLHLGAVIGPFGTLDKSWHTLNYWEPLRIKSVV